MAKTRPLDAEHRNALPDGASPSDVREEPLTEASHVRNAIAHVRGERFAPRH